MTNSGSKALADGARKLLGPAFEEAGEILADRLRYWRWKSALSILERANEIRSLKGESNENVPLKFFIPFVDECSKEDEAQSGDLQELWATLLSNSSNGSVGIDLLCIDVMKKIGSTEATTLQEISRVCTAVQERQTLFKSAHGVQLDDIIIRYNQIFQRKHAVVTRGMGTISLNMLKSSEYFLEDAPLDAAFELQRNGLFFEELVFGIGNKKVSQRCSGDRQASLIALKRLGLIRELVIPVTLNFDATHLWGTAYLDKTLEAAVDTAEFSAASVKERDDGVCHIHSFALTAFGAQFVNRVSKH